MFDRLSAPVALADHDPSQMMLHWTDLANATYLPSFSTHIPTHDATDVPKYVHYASKEHLVVVVTSQGHLHAFDVSQGLVGSSRLQHMPPREVAFGCSSSSDGDLLVRVDCALSVG